MPDMKVGFASSTPIGLSLARANVLCVDKRSACARGTRVHRPCRQVYMRVMRFRPCIDLHEGRVKQIVGSTLRDESTAESEESLATVNFDSDLPSAYYADLYARDNLPGGHVIMLGPGNERAAKEALDAYPEGLQIGGGIRPDNAAQYIEVGASHVIVTSYAFRGKMLDWDRLQDMVRVVGRKRFVVDLSCTREWTRGRWVVCTNRWQTMTETFVDQDTLGRISKYCDEILVHAVDVEGKRAGIDVELIGNLAEWAPVPITYAGGVRSLEDIELARRVSRGMVDVTVGSALDIFGGDLPYEDAVKWQRNEEARE